MESSSLPSILAAAFCLSFCQLAVQTATTDQYTLLMPHVQPKQPETYLCTAIKLDEHKTYYIVGFSPNAMSDTAHHMLLYGCVTPGRSDRVWDCGEMARKGASAEYPRGDVCGSGSQVIYAWAKDAPKLILPDGIGFKVGRNSPILYLVLQVHYAVVDAFQDGATDDSGVVLTYTDSKMPRTAGVLMMGTNGLIGPRRTEHMESACTITEKVDLHPLAFRTHTHALGMVVSGYKVTRHGIWGDNWSLIGKKSPQLPQMFYPVEDPNMVIHKGDVVAARCTMMNYRNRVTKVGPTSDDEMCNFYLLYWVEGDHPLQQKYCFTRGPPLWYWSKFPLKSIPDIDASQLV